MNSSGQYTSAEKKLPQEVQDEIGWITSQMEKMPQEIREAMSFIGGAHHGIFRRRMTERAIRMAHMKCVILPYPASQMGEQKFAQLVRKAYAG